MPGPKDKDDDSKGFFDLGDDGDIRPMKPVDPKETTRAIETHAPMFQVTPNEPSARMEPDAMKSEPSEAFLEEQLDLLKPQIDNISRLSDNAALSSDQTDVLRKYLSLKEAEVRDLRDQARQYQSLLKKVSGQLDGHTRKNRDLLSDHESMKRRDESMRAELRELKDKYNSEVVRLKNEYEERLRQSGNYDSAMEELMKTREEWRDKVKEDLKRIKLKERELENKYELLKRDTQALLDSKDKHHLELKKKCDALDLELESLEDRLRHSNSVLGSIESKKRRLVETMKLAITLLEEIDTVESDVNQKKAG